MKSFRLRLLASYGVALLVMLVAWAGSEVVSQVTDLLVKAQQTRDTIQQLNRLERALIDAETGQRGYLLTGTLSYRAPYDAAALEVDATLAELYRLTATNPQRRALLGPIAVDCAVEIAELRRTIELFESNGVVSAAKLVETGLGKRVMDRLRAGIVLLRDLEDRQRKDEVGHVSSRITLARAIVLGGSLVAFVLAIAVNKSLSSAYEEREAAQRMIESQADSLRQQTAALSVAALALKGSNEALDQFAYSTSHDLKAPLRGITNLAGWIEEDLGDGAPDNVKKHLALLAGRAKRLELLIDGILAYSRAGRMDTAIETVDAQQLVEEIRELLAPPENVRVAIDGRLPTLAISRAPLQQILMNLVQNAIKHGCAKGGTVSIAGFETSDAYRFAVSDDGPGIDPLYHERVFGIFQTLQPRDRVEGAGIGLAIVKKLVENRGGTISLTSTVGHGARFEITLPKRSQHT